MQDTQKIKEYIKLSELVKEASRIMKFIDAPLYIDTIDESSKNLIDFKILDSKAIRCIIVSFNIKELECNQDIIELKVSEALGQNKIFDLHRQRKTIDITGKVLALTREGKFMEVDLVGYRMYPILDMFDVRVSNKNPVQIEMESVLEKYPDTWKHLLDALKMSIQMRVIDNDKMKRVLSRIINYIYKIDAEAEKAQIV